MSIIESDGARTKRKKEKENNYPRQLDSFYYSFPQHIEECNTALSFSIHEEIFTNFKDRRIC